jgi:hypothetical protein
VKKQRAKWQKSKGLRKNPRHNADKTKPDIVVVVIGVVVVAVRGTAIPWIVVPGAAAFGCLPQNK